MINLQSLLISLPVILIAITIHEFAHAKVADILGDPTPRLAGRLTLNPIPHIDPIGFLMLILVGFGWAKPVPINPNNFADYKKGSAAVSLAGPLSNIFFAWLVATLIKYLPLGSLPFGYMMTVAYIVKYTVVLNVALAVFNLLPIPPLDGHHILEAFLPYSALRFYRELSQYGFLILIAILMFPPFSVFLHYAVGYIVNLLL